MVKHTCMETECGNPSRSRGYCGVHYSAKRRRGELAPVSGGPILKLHGKRFGSLTVIHYDRGLWECLCDCGRTTFSTANKLTAGRKRSCGCHSWKVIEYAAAHSKVRRALGKASNRKCVRCDKRAEHWAYTYSDPEELTSSAPQSEGFRYSLDPSFYQPMCRSCHKTFDNAVAREAKLVQ